MQAAKIAKRRGNPMAIRELYCAARAGNAGPGGTRLAHQGTPPAIRKVTTMAEAVLFDFGGTLDADGRPWCDRFHAGYRAAGGRLGLVGFSEHFSLSDRMLARQPGISGFGMGRMVAAQIELLRSLLPDGGSLDTAQWSWGFLRDTREAVARNRVVLDQLCQQFELGVVANFTGNLRPCLEELGLEDCFAVVFDSAVVGLRKPDFRLFRAAFDALGRPAEACWMVGDNPVSDIEPAARLGCATCWLAPAERPLPAGLAPTRRIAAFTELPAVLD
ncbi:MAG TPA: HAD family hydrolase [Gemmatimonadales bacterium]|nr:HAD family hydrolase [Gemmatimonadales bacterium]